MIDSGEKFDRLMARASTAKAVALDTEFVWERTFYPDLGLVQLAIGRECHLIDPLAIKNLTALGELLANPAVVKILHDAQQDLTILKQATGATPKSIFDTRLGYGFCGRPAILSLAGLLAETVKIELPKTESRTDWLKRPLTTAQIEYAEDDVKHLCEVMDIIMALAADKGNGDRLAEEMKIFDNPALYDEIEPLEAFRKIKGHQKLKTQGLAVLRELAAWREMTARKVNLPRNFVLHNNVLMDLAWMACRENNFTNGIPQLTPKQNTRYGTQIINAIKRGMTVPKEQCPKKTPDGRRDDALKARVKKLTRLVDEKAEAHEIDPGLVATRKELGQMIEPESGADNDSRVKQGWRAEFLADCLEQV